MLYCVLKLNMLYVDYVRNIKNNKKMNLIYKNVLYIIACVDYFIFCFSRLS